MLKEDAIKIVEEYFGKRHDENGVELLYNFFDSLTEETIEVNVDNFSQEEFKDFNAELIFSHYCVTQSNVNLDDYEDSYIRDPEPLLKVVCISHNPFGNLERSWYWLTIDGRDEVKEIIEKYTKEV